MNQLLGEQSEQLARDYLQQQGLKTITNNFRCKTGEIDLIMRDKTHVVFVEVRYRHHTKFGGAIESVDWFKQQRIIRTAQFYLQCEQWAQQLPSRFDVVTLSGDIQSPTIQWIKDAFETS